MANRSKAKGSAWEGALVEFFRAHGFPEAHRLTTSGRNDVGDLGHVGPFVVEAKNCRTLELRPWCDELAREMQRAGLPFGFVALKRSGTTDPGDGYAIMRLRDMAVLMELVAILDVDLGGGNDGNRGA